MTLVRSMRKRQVLRAAAAALLFVGVMFVLGCAVHSGSVASVPSSAVASSVTTATTSADAPDQGSPAATAPAEGARSSTGGVVPDGGFKPVSPELLAIRIGPNHEVLPPLKGVYTGAFSPPTPFEDGLVSLAKHSRKVGKSPAIVMWYQAWQPDDWVGGFKKNNVEQVLKRGSIPMITWEPWKAGAGVKQRAYQLKKIIAGDYDDYIRSWARGAKSVDGPIMIRPFHEMNGNWYPWGGLVNGNSPAEVKAAWRHVHDIFAEEGVTNVTWVWSINWESFPNTYANRYSVYYPGDEYVDWTSLSGFNWGKTAQRPQGRSFANLYTKPLAYLATLDKPVVISEIGCNSTVDKAAWIRDAYKRVILKHPHVKGIVYYDKRESPKSNGTQNWQISSSKSSERAYRSAISSRMFIGGSSESLLGTAGVTP